MKLIIESKITISDVQMSESTISISYEAEVGKYGQVFFSHHLQPSNNEETKGRFTGFARTITTDGGSVRGTLSGVWRRQGSNFSIHSLDDALGIPDQNYVEITADIISRDGTLKLYTLLESED